MSPVHSKAKPNTKSVKSRVPIVNVFDEDEEKQGTDLQPAHRPVVVEIEDVAHDDVNPPQPPMQHVTAEDANISAPVFAGQQTQQTVPTAPVMAPNSFAGEQAPVPHVEVSGTPMAVEPALPSFFAQDLQPSDTVTPMATPAQPMQAGVGAPMEAGSIPAQAVVGEINEVADGGGNSKKLIGIILVVLALVILAVAGLFLYAKNLFAPVELPTPTPTPIPSIRPTSTPVATPEPVASVSAEMKKSVKVDVLNGTKIAGLATKEASVLKTAGYVTGTVGNGTPADAGTIMYASASADLAKDIQKVLADFTFELKVSAKAKTIVVTLGEPSK